MGKSKNTFSVTSDEIKFTEDTTFYIKMAVFNC